jgi:methionyl-tRNA formyltransferase
MKIIFMGSQEFSVEFLKVILENNHEVLAVFTREEKPAGRKNELTKTPVHIFAETKSLKILTPKSLKNTNLEEFGEVDFIVVVGYGLILPEYFIKYPKIGCINVHPSLLPRWRGAAPIERTLWNGDKKTAATIMLMDESLDTGDILSMEEIDVSEEDNFQTLSKKLQESANSQLLNVINNYSSFTPIKQSSEGITYATKISNDNRRVDLSNIQDISCIDLYNRIRALSNKAGLILKAKNISEEFKILSAKFDQTEVAKEQYGNIIISGKELKIGCMDGCLIPESIQMTTGKGTIINNKEFVNHARNKQKV